MKKYLFAFLFALSCITGCGGDKVYEDDDSGDGGSVSNGGDALAGEDDGGSGIPGDPDPRYYEERVVLYLTNCVRSDPSFFNDHWTFRDSGAPSPSRPLHHHDGLHGAARFQAEHIDHDCTLCQDHSSCCELGLVDGQVECVGPLGGCGGTGWRDRVKFWYEHPSSENAASGQGSPEMAIYSWVNSLGHFNNLNGSSHTLLGVGQSNRIWVQNFGTGAAPDTPFAEGVHYRKVIIEGGDISRTVKLDPSDNRIFGITYYDPGMGLPDEIYVLLDGVRYDLENVYGTEDHGAYEVMIELGEGCFPYVFHLTDSVGAKYAYPEKGHLNAALDMSDGCPVYLP